MMDEVKGRGKKKSAEETYSYQIITQRSMGLGVLAGLIRGTGCLWPHPRHVHESDLGIGFIFDLSGLIRLRG